MSTIEPMDTKLHDRLHALTEQTLSPVARYVHVGLLLLATAVGVLILALLLTEPALPLRTQLAFGGMLLVAVAWIVYASWTLMHRRPLLHRHRVVAGMLATTFSAGFTAVTAVAAIVTGAAAAKAASAMGVLMLLVAIGLLRAARRRHRALVERRDALVAEAAKR